MKTRSIRPILWLVTLAMLAFAAGAQAHTTCNAAPATPTPPITINTAYPMSGGALNVTASSMAIMCAATSTTARTASYQLKATPVAPAGCTAGQARGTATGKCLTYYLALDSGCVTHWTGTTYLPATKYTTPSLSTSPGPVSDTHTFYFYACIAAGLTVPAADTYVATTNVTSVNFSTNPAGGSSSFPGTITVTMNIVAPATCTLSTPPGSIAFNYTSFGATANASTTFAATCTTYLPYTMALDATSGTINGVTYTLALSASSATGSGVAQSYTINGNIAAGQGGTCAASTCTGSQTRTLTITY